MDYAQFTIPLTQHTVSVRVEIQLFVFTATRCRCLVIVTNTVTSSVFDAVPLRTCSLVPSSRIRTPSQEHSNFKFNHRPSRMPMSLFFTANASLILPVSSIPFIIAITRHICPLFHISTKPIAPQLLQGNTCEGEQAACQALDSPCGSGPSVLCPR